MQLILNRGARICSKGQKCPNCQNGKCNLDVFENSLGMLFPNIALKTIVLPNAITLMESNVVLQDVREQEEYDVSHLPNAIRVEPDEAVDQVMRKIKEHIESKLVVHYFCQQY